MFSRMGSLLSRRSGKYMPESFVFAILLTAVAWLLGIVIARQGPFQMVRFWYDGFWELLAFGMQMVLILVTGHALASAPLMKRLPCKAAGLLLF